MLNYEGFKGRTINTNKPVMVYKNLNNGLFSIKQAGLVVAHVESVTLSDVVFKVNQGGRNRVLKERQKNVHAFAIGLVESINTIDSTNRDCAVSYDPYKCDYFYFKKNDCEAVVNSNDKVFCSASEGVYVI